MPNGQIEHANISVTDPERSAGLFKALLGWRERWRGPSLKYGWTIHVGSESSYLALYTGDHVKGDFTKGQPLNHIAFVVDDLAAAREIIVKAGLEPFNDGTYDPGPSTFYFFDWDGIEFEVVSYGKDSDGGAS